MSWLTRAGFAVVEAENGDEALEQIQQRRVRHGRARRQAARHERPRRVRADQERPRVRQHRPSSTCRRTRSTSADRTHGPDRRCRRLPGRADRPGRAGRHGAGRAALLPGPARGRDARRRPGPAGRDHARVTLAPPSPSCSAAADGALAPLRRGRRWWSPRPLDGDWSGRGRRTPATVAAWPAGIRRRRRRRRLAHAATGDAGRLGAASTGRPASRSTVATARLRADRPPLYVAVPLPADEPGTRLLTPARPGGCGAAVEAQRAARRGPPDRGHAAAQPAAAASCPTVPGIDLAVRYEPASPQAEVGGDFYELSMHRRPAAGRHRRRGRALAARRHGDGRDPPRAAGVRGRGALRRARSSASSTS